MNFIQKLYFICEMFFENYMIIADGERVNVWSRWELTSSILEIAIDDMRERRRIVPEKSRRTRSRNMSTRERSSLCVGELILSDNYNDMRQSSREEGENGTVLLSKRFINICFLIASS